MLRLLLHQIYPGLNDKGKCLLINPMFCTFLVQCIESTAVGKRLTAMVDKGHDSGSWVTNGPVTCHRRKLLVEPRFLTVLA